ncbi:hypothetical protein BFW38_10405 [Terasakiispira papahanaumokuakeensis]|uniref:DNA polymerase III subunit gamma/tau n=1 Tax=Terasakiispira papahanaumokuakeensis TaxID=197479 RepID=A0A1E2VB66_9GAMM|nr:DNA polymerase III subunit gamma/tau [Terasakiispira papahanaumokuakeensis]ODC03895.1 hypothetical protein BFW38_10405 [Terasakiispira papahanaumokuakeensis]
MSYQVLARKWRPKNFHELVGQTHVQKALINALDQDRLHHAYLFTGTRGVGKTTIARILAKCLNCETGVTSQPCGECGTCREIDEGRFVDLIEVDAASRTKVEDTRELLDNVQYSPTRGRFKVYLIDEVHMLSTHSFNALLKTLEEPPAHVKFLLATTDPQKLPMTILSRCLQLQLKNMSPERVAGHLQHVLNAENVPFDDAALKLLGRAADGSMRDALSLTDQAIAFGQGEVRVDAVTSMLGVLDHRHLQALLAALVAHDAASLLNEVAQLAEQAPDFAAVLEDLARLLHRLTLAQMVPEALDDSFGERDHLLALAQRLPAEEVQLYYQIAIESRRDLPLSPDPRTGLEMALLRMLAFRPQGIPELPEVSLQAEASSQPMTQASALQTADPQAAGYQAAGAQTTDFEPSGPQAGSSPPLNEAPPEPPKPDAAAPAMPSVESPGFAVSDTPSHDQAETQSESPRPDRQAMSEVVPDIVSEASVSAASVSETSVSEASMSESGVAPDADAGQAPSSAPWDGPAQWSTPEPTTTAPPRPAEPSALADPSERATGTRPSPNIEMPPVPQTVAEVAWPESNEHWLSVYPQLGLSGWEASLAGECCWLASEPPLLRLAAPPRVRSVLTGMAEQALTAQLSTALNTQVQLEVVAQEPLPEDSPLLRQQKITAARKAQALEKLRQDPNIQIFIQQFDAQLDEASVEPAPPAEGEGR